MFIPEVSVLWRIHASNGTAPEALARLVYWPSWFRSLGVSRMAVTTRCRRSGASEAAAAIPSRVRTPQAQAEAGTSCLRTCALASPPPSQLFPTLEVKQAGS